MTGAVIACVLFVLSAFCVVAAWKEHINRTRYLDVIGAKFGMRRWEGEGNNGYADRIVNRIMITGRNARW